MIVFLNDGNCVNLNKILTTDTAHESKVVLLLSTYCSTALNAFTPNSLTPRRSLGAGPVKVGLDVGYMVGMLVGSILGSDVGSTVGSFVGSLCIRHDVCI